MQKNALFYISSFLVAFFLKEMIAKLLKEIILNQILAI